MIQQNGIHITYLIQTLEEFSDKEEPFTIIIYVNSIESKHLIQNYA